MKAVNTPAEILLDRCANWYSFHILPDGVGWGKPTFSDMNLAILCYCDLTPAYKVFHSVGHQDTLELLRECLVCFYILDWVHLTFANL
jgi:hypothetical protein